MEMKREVKQDPRPITIYKTVQGVVKEIFRQNEGRLHHKTYYATEGFMKWMLLSVAMGIVTGWLLGAAVFNFGRLLGFS